MGLTVVKCGTVVTTTIGKIECIVTGCCIRETHIVYELSYFCQGEYKQIWVNRYEFEIKPPTKRPGFNRHDDDNETLLLTSSETEL